MEHGLDLEHKIKKRNNSETIEQCITNNNFGFSGHYDIEESNNSNNMDSKDLNIAKGSEGERQSANEEYHEAYEEESKEPNQIINNFAKNIGVDMEENYEGEEYEEDEIRFGGNINFTTQNDQQTDEKVDYFDEFIDFEGEEKLQEKQVDSDKKEVVENLSCFDEEEEICKSIDQENNIQENDNHKNEEIRELSYDADDCNNENKENDTENLKEEEDSDAKKPAPLLNNLQILFDQNTERSKKRSEQMKKMREKIKSVTTSSINSESSLTSNAIIANALTNDELSTKRNNDPFLKDSALNSHDDHSRNKTKFNSGKKFVELTENQEEKFSALESAINSKMGSVNSLSKIPSDNIEIEGEEPEQVISDLDMEIEADENEIIEQKNMHPSSRINSFIPLSNNLTLKTNISKNETNLTDSYKLALGGYIDPKSNEDSDEKDIKVKDANNSPEFQLDDNNNIKNYVLNPILEEENSDFTDSEVCSKTKNNLHSSAFLSKKGSHGEPYLQRQVSFVSNYLDENSGKVSITPKGTKQIYFTFKKNTYSKSLVDLKKLKNEGINKILGHKVSRSEVVDARLEILNLVDNLEKKNKVANKSYTQQLINKKRMILSYILKGRSNSCHNLDSIFKIEITEECKNSNLIPKVIFSEDDNIITINHNNELEYENISPIKHVLGINRDDKMLKLTIDTTDINNNHIISPLHSNKNEISLLNELSTLKTPIDIDSESKLKTASLANFKKVKKDEITKNLLLKFDANNVVEESHIDEEEDSLDEKDVFNTQNTIRKIDLNEDNIDEVNLEDIIMKNNKNVNSQARTQRKVESEQENYQKNQINNYQSSNPTDEIYFNSEEDYQSNFYSPINTEVYLKSEGSIKTNTEKNRDTKSKLNVNKTKENKLSSLNSKLNKLKLNIKESTINRGVKNQQSKTYSQTANLEQYKNNLLKKISEKECSNLQSIRDKYKALRKQASCNNYKSDEQGYPSKSISDNNTTHINNKANSALKFGLKNFGSNIIKPYNISLLDKVNHDDLIIENTYSSRTSGSNNNMANLNSNKSLKQVNMPTNTQTRSYKINTKLREKPVGLNNNFQGSLSSSLLSYNNFNNFKSLDARIHNALIFNSPIKEPNV